MSYDIRGWKFRLVPSDSALMGIRLLINVFVAASAHLSVVFLHYYPLGGSRMQEIIGDLDRRRTAYEESSAQPKASA